MTTVRDLLRQARAQLDGRTDTPAIDAEVLLAHALRRGRSWLYAWPEHQPDSAQRADFEQLVAERIRGRPVAHLSGEREFWSLRLQVTADTLIPRPETELLVETALRLPLPKDAEVLDLGTGSGAIALALASEQRAWRVNAVELSAAAIAVAEANRNRLGIGNLNIHRGDWFDALPTARRFHLIVANPPYVASVDPHLQRGDVRFEPPQALVAGKDGLDAIRRIIARAPVHLRHDGRLWLEHGHDQAEAVAGLMHDRGFAEITTRHDLAGHARISGGRWPTHGPS